MVFLKRGKKMLQKCFEDLTDTRQKWKTDHKLIEIVIVTVLAVIKEKLFVVTGELRTVCIGAWIWQHFKSSLNPSNELI